MALCPKCKEPVSQFAAGCSICGADLNKHRRDQAERKAARRVKLPGLPQISEAEVLVFLIALVVLSYPLAGIALALLAATRHPQLSFPGTLRTVLFGLAGAGLLLMAAGGSVNGLLLA